MKRKFKNKLIVFLLAIMSLLILGSCSLSKDLEETLESNNLVAQVTYYANGGSFGNGVLEKDLYYPENAKALEIGKGKITSGSLQIEYTGYELVGWYFVELDPNGDPIVENAEAGTYKLGAEVDFSKALQKDEHWIVAAKWRLLVGVKVVMVCDEGATVEVGEAKDGIKDGATSFKSGDEIGELGYDSQDQVTLSFSEPDSKLFTVKDKAYTFISYYEDAECQTPISGVLNRGEEDITIYAKYVQGDWTRVKGVGDVSAMFKGVGQGKNYWLMNDIDCAKLGTVIPPADFKGMIQGNGYTISNLKIGKSLSTSELQIAMFGKIAATAKIENITFENVTMAYTSRSEMFPEVYGVFVSIENGAQVSDVTINGSLSFDGSGDSSASNMADGYDHCLFGGYDTDDGYTGGGFTVTLEIDGQQVTNVN